MSSTGLKDLSNMKTSDLLKMNLQLKLKKPSDKAIKVSP